ncbi:SAM-dependent methyltransferases [hydrothermal vent metagenome]|uniref:SAM-dependent methyltransferases n=1 Tax=hydrothermal vent metagenome TaxID=652676 RepID=A0A3B0RXL6_9ZZZZ
MAKFKDHFSTQSKGYSKFRPSYPRELYSYLSGLCTSHDLVWDCATGTGQAARGLSPFFDRIIATDGSAQQVAKAEGPQNITFCVATAEESGLEASSVDLVTVAQALHWFAHDDFFQEAKRILKPGGILAVWTYNLLGIDQDIDRIVRLLYTKVIGEYWPPERALVDENYGSIDFPFQEIAVPDFNMTASWRLDDLLGYLSTWSAVVRYKADKGRDPIEQIRSELSAVWGDDIDEHTVNWPLSFHIGQF